MIFIYILKDKCPHCRQGVVFQNTNLLSLKAGKMNEECSVCHENFTREPGFFWGSMYVSYGLAVLEVFLTYILCIVARREAFDWLNLFIMLGVIIVLSPFNYRVARLTWLYIFAKIE